MSAYIPFEEAKALDSIEREDYSDIVPLMKEIVLKLRDEIEK